MGRRVAPLLALLVLCSGLAIIGTVGTAAAQGSLSVLSPGHGDVVGATLIVSGQSENLDGVQLQLDDQSPVLATLPQGQGQWTHTLDLSNQTQGPHTLRIEGLRTGAVPITEERQITLDLTTPTALELDLTIAPESPRVDETVTVTGFVTTDRDVRVQQATVQLSWAGASASWSTDVDALGAFDRGIVAPSSDGTIALSAAISAPELNLSATIATDVVVRPAPGPDLQVVSLSTDADPIISNSTVNLTVRLNNNGSEVAKGEVRFYEGTISTDTILAVRALTLQVGIQHVSVPFTPARNGTHEIIVQLRAELDDPDTSNNERSFLLQVEARPDVRVFDLILSNPQPEAGQAVSLRIRLENLGDNASTFQLHVRAIPMIDGLPGSPTLLYDESVRLEPGEERVMSGSDLRWEVQPGSWTIVASAAGSQPSDPRPANDVTEVEVTVAAPPEPDEPEPSPIPAPALPLTVVALLVGLLVGRRD